jgi:hypothetical protein
MNRAAHISAGVMDVKYVALALTVLRGSPEGFIESCQLFHRRGYCSLFKGRIKLMVKLPSLGRIKTGHPN